MGGGGGGDGDSSGEEDGDDGWRAAIEAAAAVGYEASRAPDSKQKQSSRNSGEEILDESRQTKGKDRGPKLSQIKAQKLLSDMLDKNLEFVKLSSPPLLDKSREFDFNSHSSGIIRLFREAPPGMTAGQADALRRQMKRPRLLPGVEIDEKSKEYRRQLRSVAVDGRDIISAAQDACQRSLARCRDREATATLKAEREKERVAELRKIRGEKWLPSVAAARQAEDCK